MRRLTLKQLFTLLLLVMLLAVPVVAMAQDDSAPAEGETTAEAAAGEEEKSVSPLAPLGINQGFLLAQIFNFLLVFGALTVFLWRPLTNMLDSRADKIAKGLEDASAAANARRNAETEAEKILAQARSEAAKVIEEARERGDEVAKSIEAEARKDADKIRTDARSSAEVERNAELSGLRGHVTSISIAVAQRLIGANLDEKRQKAMIDEFFTKVPESVRSLSGAVTVVSAMPLSEAEQTKVKKEIGASDVTFSVDPAILGGLVIRAGDRVIDGSIRSGLGELAGRLN